MGEIVKNEQGLRGAQRLVAYQLVITTLIALTAVMVSGVTAGLSAILGGLVSLLPNAYFARTLFQHQGARAAKKIVNSFYKGEAVKIALSVVMFALVFAFFSIVPLVFFATYIVVQMAFWFAPLLFVNNIK